MSAQSERAEWWDVPAPVLPGEAACAGDPLDFGVGFPGDNIDRARAEAAYQLGVCRLCDPAVKAACLGYALKWRDYGMCDGVWGGLTAPERARGDVQQTLRVVPR